MGLEASRASRAAVHGSGRLVVEPEEEGPSGPAGADAISLSSTDYLGLARHPAVIAAAQQSLAEHGLGSSQARAFAPNRSLFEALEVRLSEFKGVEAAVVFQSGYATNLGLIPCLVGPRDLLVHDEFNHPSCGDGARLSRAVVRTYRHRDANDLESILARDQRARRRPRRQIVIATDGVFGVQGDVAPLPDICAVAQRFGALLVVDDAHATGVMGRDGRGTVDHFGLHGQVDVQVGTLSKALGAVGGYVATGPGLRERLLVASHPMIYSSLPPAAVASAAVAAIGILESDPSRLRRLWTNTRLLRTRLLDAGFDLGESETPIIPLAMANRDVALSFAERLADRGVIAQARTTRRPGSEGSQVRLLVRSELAEAEVLRCADAIEAVGWELGTARRPEPAGRTA